MASAVAADGESWMVERAKEELQMLEAMHPNGFDCLKLELKSFIFEVDANTYDSYASAAAAAATQGSCTLLSPIPYILNTSLETNLLN